MLAQLMTKPCLIVSRSDAGTVDDLGNPMTDETLVETVCELQQRRRDEPDLQGELADSTWDLFLPAGTAIGTDDAVEVDGHRYELVGEPWDAAHDMSPAVAHVWATVRRTASAEDRS
jgi:hypothetical protein